MNSSQLSPVTLAVRGDGGAFLTIAVYKYTYPDASDFWDGNWLDCKINASAHGFSARVGLSLRAEEFVEFLPQLRQIAEPAEAKVDFTTMEETLALTVEVQRGGRCAIRGEVRIHVLACLEFAFESDRSYLRSSITELQSIVDQFPVRGSPADA